VDCLTNGRNVINWTSVGAANSAVFEIPGTRNGIIANANDYETRQIMVELDTGLSTQVRNATTWKVKNNRTFEPMVDFDDALLLEPYYPITALESAASVTPENYTYPPGHVLRYGANIDPGVTDMTVTIQTACDSGHDVFIPKGIFGVTGVGTFPGTNENVVNKYSFRLTSVHDDLGIYGEEGAELKMIDNGTARNAPVMFWMDNVTGVRFSGISFNGNASGTFANDPRILQYGTQAIYFRASTNGSNDNIKISDCRFLYFNNVAIGGYGGQGYPDSQPYTSNVEIAHCYFEGAGDHGIGINSADRWRIHDCVFYNMGLQQDAATLGGMGVDLSAGSKNCVVSHCIVDTASAGFKTETHTLLDGVTPYAAVDNVIDSCIVRNLYTSAGMQAWYGFKAGGKRTTITNCIVEDSYGYGILISADECTVSNNRIRGGSYSTGSGIYVNGADPRFTPVALNGNNIISNNYVSGAGGYGIFCLGSQTVITNNIVYANLGGGIRVADPNDDSLPTKHVQIASNIVYNNTGLGIAIAQIAAGAEEISDVVITGNSCFDTRAGGSRTQTRGIFVEDFNAATANTFDIVEANNQCFNNTTQDYSLTTNVATRLANGNRTLSYTAAPTVGTWAVGDIVMNSAVAAAGVSGWMCTTAGTPGTWKAMANVAA